MRLGKLAPKYNEKTLSFARYFKGVELPDVPSKVYWEYKIPDDAWGMFGNDTIGDCTCACVAHMIMLATAHTGKLVFPDESDIIKAYSAISGYVPGDESTDNGAAITDVLDYWKTTGIAGHKILGWAQVDQTNPTRIMQAIYLFGAVDIGIQVPSSAMDQFNAGQPWDVVLGSSIEGGHSIPLFGKGSQGDTCVTWAKRQQMGNPFFSKYCDEAYCVITPDWINSQGLSPSGLDMDALQDDLQEIKS